VAAALTAIVVVLGVDAAAIWTRLDHQPVALPEPVAEDIWLLIGSDDRADVPEGTDPSGLGVAVTGQRADVVVLVKIDSDATSRAVVLPRDIVVSPSAGTVDRLTLTFEGGPQGVVDGLSRSLGVSVGHVVTVTMAGFAAVVDAVGGLEVEIPAPVRDRLADLSLAEAGSQRVGGLEALALVRSRHPEILDGGAWRSVGGVEGAALRTAWTAGLFSALRRAAVRAIRNPIGLQRLAWAASGAVTLDAGTSPLELRQLAGAKLSIATAPAEPLDTGDAVALIANDETQQVLTEAGLAGNCALAD